MLSKFPPNGLFLVEKAKSARRLCLAAAVGRIVCRHSRTERRKNRGKTSEKYKFHSKRAQCTRKRSTSQSCTHAYVCAMRLSVARCARNGWRLSTSRDRSSVWQPSLAVQASRRATEQEPRTPKRFSTKLASFYTSQRALGCHRVQRVRVFL